MSRINLVPSPVGSDWRAWATKLVAYLSQEQSTEVINQPRPVALGHKLPSRETSAVNPGVMLYEPSIGAPIYSDGSDWVTVASVDWVDTELGDYLPLTGGTLTGPLTVANTLDVISNAGSPWVRLKRSDNATGNQAWGFGISATGDLHVRKLNDNLSTQPQVDALFTGLGTAASDYRTVMTREKGDARYLSLTGGTLTGQVVIPTGGSSAEPMIKFAGYGMGMRGATDDRIIFSVASSNAAAVDAPGPTAGNTYTIMTREKSDARYLTLTGGYLKGNLTIDTDGNGIIYFYDSTHTTLRGLHGMVGVNYDARVYDTSTGNIAARLNLNASGQFTIRTNEGLRLTMSDAGAYFSTNTGMGMQPSTSTKLRVSSDGTTSATFALACYDSSQTTQLFLVRSDGRVSAGQATYAATTAAAANTVVDSNGFFARSTSSGAFKIDRQPLSEALAIIGALNPVSFLSTHESDNGRRYTGFIAEEIATAIPEAATDENTNYDVRAIVAYLVKAVQELSSELAAIKSGADNESVTSDTGDGGVQPTT